MNVEQVIGLSIALIIMFLGLAGSILPGLPSTPLVMAAAVGHKLYFGPTGPAWWVLLILGLITALSLVMDYLTTVYGAKKVGRDMARGHRRHRGRSCRNIFQLPWDHSGPFYWRDGI